MKAVIIYSDWQGIDRDTRLDEVACGMVLFSRPEAYAVVDTFVQQPGKDDPEELCEYLYREYQDGATGVRSMSVGDVVLITDDEDRTEPYVCDAFGFRNVSHNPQCGSWIEQVLSGPTYTMLELSRLSLEQFLAAPFVMWARYVRDQGPNPQWRSEASAWLKAWWGHYDSDEAKEVFRQTDLARGLEWSDRTHNQILRQVQG